MHFVRRAVIAFEIKAFCRQCIRNIGHRIVYGCLHISDIGRIGRRISAAGYVRDGLVIRIEAVIGYIGLSAYGQSVIIDHRIARCDAVHFHVFRQFDIQRICPVGYHADISVCQLRCICHTADDIRLFA